MINFIKDIYMYTYT